MSIRKITLAIAATVATAAPLAVPAIASANGTTNSVARQFSTQIHNRARVAGFAVTATSLNCASDGGGYYSCFATYTALLGSQHAKYGIYLDITPRNWHTVGTATLMRIW